MPAPQLPVPKNLSRQFEPIGSSVEGARAYTGGSWRAEGLGDAQVDHERQYATALAYRDALSAPEAPGIRASYAAMGEHINRQYEHMTKPKEEGGMGLKHEVVPHDPYANPDEMAADVRQGRIQTLATSVTGPVPGLGDETNDHFRAVHDVFGHTTTGRGFSRHGEDAAYHAHRQMFPPEAHAALASDLRGQNAMLVNPHLHGDTAVTGETFVGQDHGKLIGLPDWAGGDGPIPQRSPFKPGSKRTAPIRYKQDSLF